MSQDLIDGIHGLIETQLAAWRESQTAALTARQSVSKDCADFWRTDAATHQAFAIQLAGLLAKPAQSDVMRLWSVTFRGSSTGKEDNQWVSLLIGADTARQAVEIAVQHQDALPEPNAIDVESRGTIANWPVGHATVTR